MKLICVSIFIEVRICLLYTSNNIFVQKYPVKEVEVKEDMGFMMADNQVVGTDVFDEYPPYDEWISCCLLYTSQQKADRSQTREFPDREQIRVVKICSGTAGEIMRDTDKSRRGGTEIYGFISRRSSYDPERKLSLIHI